MINAVWLQVKAGDRVIQTVEHTHQFDGTVADLDLLSIDPGQILQKFRKNLPEGKIRSRWTLFKDKHVIET